MYSTYLKLCKDAELPSTTNIHPAPEWCGKKYRKNEGMGKSLNRKRKKVEQQRIRIKCRKWRTRRRRRFVIIKINFIFTYIFYTFWLYLHTHAAFLYRTQRCMDYNCLFAIFAIFSSFLHHLLSLSLFISFSLSFSLSASTLQWSHCFTTFLWAFVFA